MKFFTYLSFIFLGTTLFLFRDAGHEKMPQADRNWLIFYTSDNPFPDESGNDDANNYNGSDYQYQNIPVYTGHYQSKYGIAGADENGKSVSGNIEIRGRSGSGVVADANGNKREVDVKMTESGSLVGVDESGRKYSLNHQ